MWLASKEFDFIRKIRGYIVSSGMRTNIGRGCVIKNVEFSDGVTIEDYVRIIGEKKIFIGKNVYINCYTMISGEITIADNVLVSQFVNIWGRSHRFEEKNKLIWDQHGMHGVTDQGYREAPVIIGHGAWIGPHVTVVRGVTIGEGAVIGANSVVTKDIPEYTVCYGIPARVIKHRL